ncbi:DDE-type integrase/transposase/recombinase [Aurantiacibacter sp. D1-12]|uniref:DDE-type integrase/transposase/recombinase n=1 Tax=Aurantiacibacter sp. D1-12 TaxID=2993658 RepID=UPI00237CE435|nr:DDE-type integrase/transposase/recombinase [Aurantiacibacter sp. D1-12]MDE1468462.1 DDE-type integrase/transposase/recombinase [Aurantiacibacter sp. D1-12]
MFAWNAHPTGTTTANYTVNGLNQYTQINGNGICHDANGNLTADGTYAYLYDNENRLVQMRARVGSTCPTNTTGYTGALSAQLEYDPMGRLYEVRSYTNGALTDTRRFLYDGDALVGEYSTSGTMLARYLHGPAAGVDDPLVSFAGSTTAANNAIYLYSDARGSIVYSTNRWRWGVLTSANTYDPYGVPGTGNTGRFQYTGQIWLEALGLYYYKARMYSPTLGRFMQKRDTKPALKFFRKALRCQGQAEKIATGDLKYPSSMRELGNESRREMGRRLNNRAENSHLPFRRRERVMQRFRRMKSLQNFASVHANIYNHFNSVQLCHCCANRRRVAVGLTASLPCGALP